jgi:hypothetical protein
MPLEKLDRLMHAQIPIKDRSAASLCGLFPPSSQCRIALTRIRSAAQLWLWIYPLSFYAAARSTSWFLDRWSAAESISRARKSRDFTAGMLNLSHRAVSLSSSSWRSRRTRTCRYFEGSPSTARRIASATSTRANDWCGDSQEEGRMSRSLIV